MAILQRELSPLLFKMLTDSWVQEPTGHILHSTELKGQNPERMMATSSPMMNWSKMSNWK
jgi:hypothetical protein